MKRVLIILMLAGGLSAPTCYGQGGALTGAFDGLYNVKTYGAHGDGTTDDTQAIAAALTAAAAAKGTVYFPTGTYIISSSLTPAADVTLLGAGRNSSFLKASVGFRNNSAALVNIVNSANRVQVRDLGFISYSASRDVNTDAVYAINMLGVQDCVVERCWFDDGFWFSVFIGGSNNSGVINSVSEGTIFSHGIEINNSSYCYAINNHLKNSATNGIEVYQNTGKKTIGNRLIGNSIEGPRGNGIHLDGDRDTTVIGNTVQGTGGSGLYVRYSEVIGTDYLSQGGHAVGNTFINCGGSANYGIGLVWARGWVVRDNTVRGAGNIGIYVGGEANSVSGNSVSESARTGIYVNDGSGHTVANNIVYDSSASGAGYFDGILVGSSGNSIIGNRCMDTRTTGKSQRYGILLLGNNNTLTGNITGGNRDGGMLDLGKNNIKTGNI